MDPLSALGVLANVVALYQVTAEVTKLCLRYAQDVRHGSRDMVQFVDGILQFQTSLCRLAKPLSDEGARADGEDRLCYLRDVLHEDAPSFQQCKRDLDDLLQRLQRALGRDGSARRRAPWTWPFSADEARRLVQRMHVIEDAITKAVTLDSNELLRTIDTRLQTSQQLAEAHQERTQDQAQREAIRTWLKHPNPSESHSAACGVRNEGIDPGRWLLESAEFQQYTATKRSLLWLHGMPGCGKTVLSSLVIDHLRAGRETGNQSQTAFWYFSSNDQERMTVENLLRSLIHQLIPPPPAKVPKHIIDRWSSNDRGSDAPKLAELGAMLRALLLETPDTEYFIVIDAFDESSNASHERAYLFTFLRDLLATDLLSVHVLITSRTQDDFRVQLQALDSCLDVTIARQVDNDIAMHIESEFQHDPSLNKWPAKDLQRTKSTLIGKANGMFRWVDCQLRQLRGCRRLADLDRVLKSLPKDVNEQYERELSKVPENDAKDVLRILQWLAFPKRALRVGEVVEMLAVNLDTDPPRFSEDERMLDPHGILEVCGSLVRIDRTYTFDQLQSTSTEIEKLTTAHSTVLEFLTTRSFQIGSQLHCTLRSGLARLQMAETCLAYLLHIIHAEPQISQDRLAAYPFARYCIEYWHIMYRSALNDPEGLDFGRFNSMVIRMLENETTISAYWQLLYLIDPILTEFEESTPSPDQLKPPTAPVYYAALYGLTTVLEHFLSDEVDLNRIIPNTRSTPLIAACSNGHVDTVDVLLRSGADPNVPCWLGLPLAIAISMDQVEVVKLLLQQPSVNINGPRMPRGVPMESEDQQGQPTTQPASTTPTDPFADDASFSSTVKAPSIVEDASEGMVYVAVKYNAMRTLPLLLAHGADPNVVGGRYHTALMSACVYSEENLELLLEAGAQMNIYGGYFGSPLNLACSKGSLSLMKKFTDLGIDLNIVDSSGFTPLSLASGLGQEDSVDLLLQCGAQVDVDNPIARQALFAASQLGHIRIMEKLITAGADVNRRDPLFNNALTRACLCQQMEAVRLLLQHGADPNALSDDYSPNAVQMAVVRGNEELLDILMSHGADYHGRGKPHGNSLLAAVVVNKISMMERLVNSGMPVDDHDAECTYPLIRAAQLGNVETVKWLLDHGAAVNAFDESDTDYGQSQPTALHSCSTVKVAQLLLERGATIDCWSASAGTPLNAAANAGNVEMVKFLLQQGADLSIADSDGMTPVLSAAYRAHDDVMKVLSQNGADLGSRNARGHGAMTIAVLKADRSLLDAFHSKGVQPQLSDARGVADIHYAAHSGNLPLLEHLIDTLGQDVLLRDSNGWTTLHWAAKSSRSSVSVLKKLLACGVDSSLQDAQGRTAVDISRSLRSEDETRVLEAMDEPGISEALTPTNLARETSSENRWEGAVCDLCQGSRGDRYHCTSCPGYDLCFRCILDKDSVHSSEHTFDCILKDGDGFPPSTGTPNVLLNTDGADTSANVLLNSQKYEPFSRNSIVAPSRESLRVSTQFAGAATTPGGDLSTDRLKARSMEEPITQSFLPPSTNAGQAEEEVDLKLPLQGSDEVLGPFRLKSESSPITPSGRISTFRPLDMLFALEGEQPPPSGLRHGSLSQGLVYPPNHQPISTRLSTIQGSPTTSQHPSLEPSRDSIKSNISAPETSLQQRPDILVPGGLQQARNQAPASKGALPAGLLVGGGRRSSSPSKTAAAEASAHSANSSMSSHSMQRQDAIPSGLVPGRPTAPSPSPAGVSGSWDTRLYTQTPMGPPIPPRVSPTPPMQSVASSHVRPQPPQPLQSHPSPGASPNALPRSLAPGNLHKFPPRQSSLDSRSSPVPDQSPRHSNVSVGSEGEQNISYYRTGYTPQPPHSAGSASSTGNRDRKESSAGLPASLLPARPGTQGSVSSLPGFRPDQHISPRSSSITSPTIRPVLSTNNSSSSIPTSLLASRPSPRPSVSEVVPARADTRPTSSESASSPQLGTFALPIEVSLGYGGDFGFTPATDPARLSTAAPSELDAGSDAGVPEPRTGVQELPASEFDTAERNDSASTDSEPRTSEPPAITTRRPSQPPRPIAIHTHHSRESLDRIAPPLRSAELRARGGPSALEPSDAVPTPAGGASSAPPSGPATSADARAIANAAAAAAGRIRPPPPGSNAIPARKPLSTPLRSPPAAASSVAPAAPPVDGPIVAPPIASRISRAPTLPPLEVAPFDVAFRTGSPATGLPPPPPAPPDTQTVAPDARDSVHFLGTAQFGTVTTITAKHSPGQVRRIRIKSPPPTISSVPGSIGSGARRASPDKENKAKAAASETQAGAAGGGSALPAQPVRQAVKLVNITSPRNGTVKSPDRTPQAAPPAAPPQPADPKAAERAKWERGRVDYDQLYGDDDEWGDGYY